MVPIRGMFVEDHPMVAAALVAIVEDEADIEVVGVATTLAGAIELARSCAPHVVMADFRLPDGDGAAAARALRALDPAPQVVMLTADAEDRTLLAALAAGCCGLVTKGVASARLGPAIRAAAVGDGVFSPDVASRVAHLQPEGNGGAALSGREIAVLEAVARGRERAEIARDLEVSESAVRTHLRDVLTKFGPG